MSTEAHLAVVYVDDDGRWTASRRSTWRAIQRPGRALVRLHSKLGDTIDHPRFVETARGDVITFTPGQR